MLQISPSPYPSPVGRGDMQEYVNINVGITMLGFNNILSNGGKDT